MFFTNSYELDLLLFICNFVVVVPYVHLIVWGSMGIEHLSCLYIHPLLIVGNLRGYVLLSKLIFYFH